MNEVDGSARLLENLVAEYVDSPSAEQPAMRAALLARHPELAAELGRFFADYDRFRFLGTPVDVAEHRDGVSFEPGARLGDYEIIEEIARGGMGVVFKARQVSLDRIVALKFIIGGRLASDRDRIRFRREAAAAAGLQHPHIVSIYDVGAHEGQHFFSMQYVEGGTLAEERARFSGAPSSAACLVEALSRAVEYAHRRGVLHRDLKPANVLVDADGQPHVSDFGLAKRLSEEVTLTKSGAVLGTPTYMAPEQADARGGQDTPATDVYSLGAMLYELLTDGPPFRGTTALEVIEQVRDREPLRPRTLNPGIPVDLETICLKCLEKDPRRRYASASELGEELRRFLDGRPIVARPVSALGRTYRVCRRNPVVSSLVAGIVLALLALAVGSWWARASTLESLRQSYVDQARLGRQSGRPGQRFRTLALLERAAAIRADGVLRDEVLAALPLVDVEPIHEVELYHGGRMVGEPWSANRFPVALDGRFERFVACRNGGGLAVGDPTGRGETAILAADRAFTRVDISPDGRFVAARDVDSRLVVFDLLEPTEPRIEVPIFAIDQPWDFRADSRELAIGLRDGAVLLQSLVSLDSRTRLPSDGVSLDAAHVRFRPDGDAVAVRGRRSGTIEIRDVETGLAVRSVAARGFVVDLEWHPDGRYLAAAIDELIHVFDTRAGGRSRAIRATGRVNHLAFHPGGDVLASSGLKNSLRLWSLGGRELLRIDDHVFVRFSEDGGFLSAVRMSGELAVSRVETESEWRVLASLPAADRISSIAMSPDSGVLAVGTSAGAFLLDPAAGLEPVPLPTGLTSFVAFDHSGESFFTWGRRGLYRWPIARSSDPETGDALRVGPPVHLGIDGHGKNIGWGSLSPDGRTVVIVVDCARGEVVAVDWRAPGEPVWMVPRGRKGHAVMSPDGRLVAGGGSSTLAVWNAETGELIRDMPAIGVVEFTPDGRRLVSGGHFGEYVYWDVDSWTEAGRIEKDAFCGPFGTLSSAGVLALRNTRTSLKLFDAGTGREIGDVATMNPTEDRALCFSPSGRRLFVGGGHQVCVLDLDSVEERLAAMGLSWDLPASPPSPQPKVSRDGPERPPLRIEIEPGSLR